jgi:hypothetical protein
MAPQSPVYPRDTGAQGGLPVQAAPVQRRSRAARRDPLEPKQNKTPFNFFSIDARTKAKAANPNADQKVAPHFLQNLYSPLGSSRCTL